MILVSKRDNKAYSVSHKNNILLEKDSKHIDRTNIRLTKILRNALARLPRELKKTWYFYRKKKPQEPFSVKACSFWRSWMR